MSGYYPKRSHTVIDANNKIRECRQAIQILEDLVDETTEFKQKCILDNKEYINPEDFKQFNDKKISELTLIYSRENGSVEFAFIDSTYNNIEIKDGYIICQVGDYWITNDEGEYYANDIYSPDPEKINIIGIYDVVIVDD